MLILIMADKRHNPQSKSPPRGPRAVSISNPTDASPKDVIHPSESGVVVESESNRTMDLEQQSSVKPLEGDVLKALIPLESKPKWPNWSLDYLRAVIKCRTDGEAARRIGLSYQTVYEARLSLADFAAAWDDCRKYRDSLIVSDLEDVGLTRALACDPDDRMSASLNMFHLKARDDKYKDKQQLGQVAINITLGYQIPETKRDSGPVIDAEFE